MNQQTNYDAIAERAETLWAITNAADALERAHRQLVNAVAEAYGALPIREIAEAAGVTRPTVYSMLREAGVTLKGTKPQGAVTA